MNSDVLSRIADIRQRVAEIRDHFAPSRPRLDFGRSLAQAAEPAASSTGAATRAIPGASAAPSGAATSGAPAIAGGRLGAYAGAISQAANSQGVDPALVQAVMQAESGGDPQARSPVGALGLMQLMPETARDLGVKNPLDPVENIQGGTKYLAGLTQRYGLEDGIAAYNAGPGAVERHHGVPPYPETQHYVKKVLDLYAQFKRPQDGGNTP